MIVSAAGSGDNAVSLYWPIGPLVAVTAFTSAATKISVLLVPVMLTTGGPVKSGGLGTKHFHITNWVSLLRTSSYC